MGSKRYHFAQLAGRRKLLRDQRRTLWQKVPAHRSRGIGRDETADFDTAAKTDIPNDGFAKRVHSIPEILECHRVAGEATYLLKVKTDNTRTLDNLLSQILRTIPGVTGTLTTIALASVKEGTRVPVTR